MRLGRPQGQKFSKGAFGERFQRGPSAPAHPHILGPRQVLLPGLMLALFDLVADVVRVDGVRFWALWRRAGGPSTGGCDRGDEAWLR